MDGEWGTVCGDSWNLTEASVVCRQLGFPFAKSAGAGYYGPGRGRIWLTNVSCSGEESELMRCSYHKAQGPLENCDHYDDIGVMCYMGELSMLYLVTKGPPEAESVQCEDMHALKWL